MVKESFYINEFDDSYSILQLVFHNFSKKQR
jgi:hypothetical protein